MMEAVREKAKKVCDGVLGAMLILNVVAIAACFVSPYRLFVVRSDSMEPAFPVGCVVISERVGDGTELRVGDVVTYKNPAVPFTITHRIVEVTERGFVTKGDNLNEDDGEIPGEWVKYRVVGRGW